MTAKSHPRERLEPDRINEVRSGLLGERGSGFAEGASQVRNFTGDFSFGGVPRRSSRDAEFRSQNVGDLMRVGASMGRGREIVGSKSPSCTS